MKIANLKLKNPDPNNKNLTRLVDQYTALLSEVSKRNLPDDIVEVINTEIQQVNESSGPPSEVIKSLKKIQSRLLKELEEKMSIVTIGHFRNTWLVMGIAIFGVPLGAAFGLAINNMGMLAIGLPIGVAIGIAVGMNKDKKAFDEGRQLNVEIKY